MILIIALVNPLFSASGSTELFRIGMRAVYLESMVYGLCMGGLFVASVLWFEAAAAMLEYDKGARAAGNAAPVIALMISMCMRLIPQFCAAVVRCWRCRMRLMCRAVRRPTPCARACGRQAC